jgi:hypothetical protein
VPTLNDVLAGSQAQAVQVQQIIDALKGTPNKGVPVALVSLNDPNNYALTVQNDDPVNSRALSVLKADGTTLISADATGVTLGSPVNVPPGSISGSAIAAGSITNAMLGADVARANLLVNGGMELWQRGAGAFTGTGAYSADRWVGTLAGTDTLSVSRDTANVDVASQYCAACTFVLGTGAGGTTLGQGLNDLYLSLRGKTVTVSARVKTSVANGVRLRLNDGGTTGTQRGNFHSGSGAYETISLTYAVSTNATQFPVNVEFDVSGTYYIDNAMLVMGSQAANYAPLSPADDLARCLRYYEVMVGGTANQFVGIGHAPATTTAYVSKPYRVQKPITPTINITAANTFQALGATGVGLTATGVAASATTQIDTGIIVTVASGLVAGNASLFQSTSGVISAEANA